MTRIKPKIGEEYKLYTTETSKDQSSFKSFYLGNVPVKTPWYLALQNPEGYIFVRENDKGEIEYYCHAAPVKTIQLMYYSDGDDGPEWEAGFPVDKIEVKLSKLEKQFLEKRIENWRGLKKAV